MDTTSEGCCLGYAMDGSTNLEFIQRQKLLLNNFRAQRKFRLWPASGSNPGDVEQDQFTDKFGTQIVENQNKNVFSLDFT